MTVVAVTGCSGYIGSRLLRFMDDDDKITRVIGVDIAAPAYRTDKMVFHNLDVRDPRLSGLFMKEVVEKVVHLAFVVNPMHDEDLERDIDVRGTMNVLSATASCKARQLVLASSTTAFGAFPDNPEWLTEEDQPRRHPNYTYASDKYEVEAIARAFRDENPGVKVAVVRPCIVYGPNVDNYLSRFILRLPALPGAKGFHPVMQFVHEDDAAEVFIRVLEREAHGYFHAVGKGVISIDSIARLAGKRVVYLPPRLLYPSVNLLWRTRFPRIEGSAGMMDFLRYRWTASDKITREKLGLGTVRSSEEVVRLMLETHGVKARA